MIPSKSAGWQWCGGPHFLCLSISCVCILKRTSKPLLDLILPLWLRVNSVDRASEFGSIRCCGFGGFGKHSCSSPEWQQKGIFFPEVGGVWRTQDGVLCQTVLVSWRCLLASNTGCLFHCWVTVSLGNLPPEKAEKSPPRFPDWRQKCKAWKGPKALGLIGSLASPRLLPPLAVFKSHRIIEG